MKNNINVCSRICNDCPFSKESIPGWLADYSVQDIINFQNGEASFPCHKMMPEGGLSVSETDARIRAGEMKLCRGYVESVIKSCKSPRENKLLIEAIAQVKTEGKSEKSMAIWDFKKHHEQYQNRK